MTIDLQFFKAAVNPVRLEQELTAALGAVFVRLEIGGTLPGELHVFLEGSATSIQIDLAGATVAAHDPYAPDELPPVEPPPEQPGVVFDLVYELAALNPDKLHEELMAVAADKGYTGLSGGPGKLMRLHFLSDQMGGADVAALTAPVIQAHDPLAKTGDQAKTDATAALLETLKKPWAEWTPEDKDSVLHVLADNLIDLPQG
jgi:hypothetical protein